jgi:hypothetical protein
MTEQTPERNNLTKRRQMYVFNGDYAGLSETSAVRQETGTQASHLLGDVALFELSWQQYVTKTNLAFCTQQPKAGIEFRRHSGQWACEIVDLSGLRFLEGSLQRRKDMLADVIRVNLSFFEYGYGFEDALGFFEARLRHHESEMVRDTVR